MQVEKQHFFEKEILSSNFYNVISLKKETQKDECPGKTSPFHIKMMWLHIEKINQQIHIGVELSIAIVVLPVDQQMLLFQHPFFLI